MLRLHKTSGFFCEGTVGYFACKTESEPRLGGFTKAMARSRLTYLIKTGRIDQDEAPRIGQQIDCSDLPSKSEVDFIQI